MSKSLKSILFAIVGLMGLLILISVVLFFFVGTSGYKSRLERAASEALGMEVHVGGRTRALDNLSLTDGVFLYGDEQSGEGFEVGNFKLDLRSSQIAGGNSAALSGNRWWRSQTS